MAVNNYFVFAENDYQYLMSTYNDGYIANCMGSVSQNVCERYMKHIIQEYDTLDQENADREISRTRVLHTHSLNVLIKYIEDDMSLTINEDAKNAMKKIDGFYFTTRYPGDESFIMNQEDVDDCITAIKLCRTNMLQIEQNILQEQLHNANELNEEIQIAQCLRNVQMYMQSPSENTPDHEL